MKIQSFKILNKRAFIVQIVILILVLIGIGYGLYYSNTKNDFVSESVTIVDDSELKTMKVTIQVPDRFEQYMVEMNKYIYEGAKNPSNDWKFVSKEVTVYSRSSDIITVSAQAAAEQIDTQGGIPSAEVVYLKIVNKTAYILLAMNIDSWLGTSASLAKIKPLVEKTLLQFKGIDSVVFDVAPGDSEEQVSRSYKRKSITVISPYGGEQLIVGNKYEIVWSSSNNSELVRLFLIPGNIPITPLSNAAAGFSSPFSWTIDKKIVPGKYKIEARQYSDYGDVPILIAIDQSSEFIITENNTPIPTPQPTAKVSPITVLSPNGGEQLLPYSAHMIKWNYTNATSTSKVDLYLEKYYSCIDSKIYYVTPCIVGVSPEIVLDKNIQAGALYNWVVGTDIINNPISPGAYKMKVCVAGTNICDYGDNYFTITTSQKIVTEKLSDATKNKYYAVNIQTEGFATSTLKWQIINGTLPTGLHIQNQGVYCLTVYPGNCSAPDSVLSGGMISGKPTQEGRYTFTVKVSNDTQSATKAYSINVVNQPNPPVQLITVVSPNGGEQLSSGSMHQIKWNYPNATSTSKVDLYLEKSHPCLFNIKGVVACSFALSPAIVLDKNIAVSTAYYWIVGTDIVNNIISPGYYQMKVCVAGTVATPTNCDKSDSYFIILPSTNSSARIEPLTLPDSPSNGYFTKNLEVFGFSTSTVRWEIISGSLPPGFYLRKQYMTCQPVPFGAVAGECPIPDYMMFRATIIGSPTQAGNYNFTVKASNETQSVTKTYSLNLY